MKLDLQQNNGDDVVIETIIGNDGVVRLEVTRTVGDRVHAVSVELDSRTTHDLGLGLLTSAWEATKASLGIVAETYRRLGFFH